MSELQRACGTWASPCRPVADTEKVAKLRAIAKTADALDGYSFAIAAFDVWNISATCYVAAMFGICEICARGSDLLHRCFIALLRLALALRKILMAKHHPRANGGQLGLLLLCLGVGSVVGMPLTGVLNARFGSRPVIMLLCAVPACARLATTRYA